jgi:hypothetical protein
MSKKRLRNKNLKTKKKIRGGNPEELKFSSIVPGLKNAVNESKSAASDSVQKSVLGQADSVQKSVLGQADSVQKSVLGHADSVQKSVLANAETVVSDKVDDVRGAEFAKAESLIPDSASNLSNSASKFANIGSKIAETGSKFADTASLLKQKMTSLSPESKFHYALIKQSANPDFKKYFATELNSILVSEFYNILTELGKYSINYSDTVEKINKIVGENIFDEDKYFYSDLNVFPVQQSAESSEPNCTTSVEEHDDKLNIEKILDDANINEFIKNAMILSVPNVQETFIHLGKVIKKYKKIRNEMNGLLQKTDNIEKYLDDYRTISDDAIQQINEILSEYDTTMGGGSCQAENNDPTMPLDQDDYEKQSHTYKPDFNSDCLEEAAQKMVELDKMYNQKTNKVDIKDVFYETLLKMCEDSSKNLSKLLKRKLSAILNRMIKRLYDIANSKKIINGNEINDDDFTGSQYKYLETDENSNNYDIDEFQTRISQKVADLNSKRVELDKRKHEYAVKTKENREYILKTGGADFFLPENLREQANENEDESLKNELQKIEQEENLEIVKYQKTIAKMVKQVFCKIRKNSIDSQPFKDIVKPAFIKKQQQFNAIHLFWKNDISEKEKLIKQLKDAEKKKNIENGEDAEIDQYITDLKMEIQKAVDNQNKIKEYIKSGKEREKDKKNKKKREEEEERKRDINKQKVRKDTAKKNLTIFLGSANNKYPPKKNFVAVSKSNYASIFIVKRGIKGYYFYKTNCAQIMATIDNEEITNGATIYQDINTIKKSYYLFDKSRIVEFCRLKKAFAGGTTRKFSSPVFRKTRRHKRTSL